MRGGFLLGLVCLLAACADGSGVQEDDGNGGGGASSGSAAGGETAGPGAGGGGGEAAEGGAGGEAPTCSYAASTMCNSAFDIVEVPGDDGAAMQVQLGTTSQWFKVQIRETKFDPVDQDENPLSYTVTLQSPPGMDFDLYVQEGTSDGPQECMGTPVQGSGAIETVTSSWSDDIDFGDDKDDHRWLSIEVRYVSGTVCEATSQWKLTVLGHT